MPFSSVHERKSGSAPIAIDAAQADIVLTIVDFFIPVYILLMNYG
ncbi:hypothetical protein R80B4_02353 [Fibrobacteres bacterium R8-0-B4]